MLSSPVNSRAFKLKGHLINSSSFYQLTRNSWNVSIIFEKIMKYRWQSNTNALMFYVSFWNLFATVQSQI